MFELNKTLTYQGLVLFWKQIKDFLITLGEIGVNFSRVVRYILNLRINISETIEQSKRFAFDSLPISLTIVGMTSIIIAMQLAPELARQGGASYTGMLSALVMVRELAAVMSGFAIISMVGSSFASEIASMAVTEQLSAMKVLRVDPIEYLIVPSDALGSAAVLSCVKNNVKIITVKNKTTLDITKDKLNIVPDMEFESYEECLEKIKTVY